MTETSVKSKRVQTLEDLLASIEEKIIRKVRSEVGQQGNTLPSKIIEDLVSQVKTEAREFIGLQKDTWGEIKTIKPDTVLGKVMQDLVEQGLHSKLLQAVKEALADITLTPKEVKALQDQYRSALFETLSEQLMAQVEEDAEKVFKELHSSITKQIGLNLPTPE
jgi:flagellar biosynthesis component FlhA